MFYWKRIVGNIMALLAIFTLSSAVEFSSTLPIEMKQLVESFESFTKEDKLSIYAYSLALKYRFEHIKDTEALKKSDLDYWRLWHIVSDIESKCGLNYKFDDILEEVLFPTSKLQKELKRLRWAESAIDTDGSSESSERMRRYDKKLQEKINSNPPQWKFSKKNSYLGDYNLTFMKYLPENTIAIRDYENIAKQTQNDTIKRKFLLRYAYLQENFIRNYDDKKKRKLISSELSYLTSCFKYYNLPQHSTYYGNEKRKLAGRVLYGNGIGTIYGKELLPNQIKDYCEHNISSMSLDTFIVKKDTPTLKPKVEKRVTYEKTIGLLNLYQQKSIDVQEYREYFNLVKIMLKGRGNDLQSALKIIRIKRCFIQKEKKYSKKFLQVLLEEIKNNNLKEEFSNKVMKPQMWWMMTIGMKINQEGETKALKHFFDCNASNSFPSQNMLKRNIKTTSHVTSTYRKNYDSILDQKDKILKYYAATFVNKPTPNINNKIAIQSGIIPPEQIETNNTIKVMADVPLKIEGMPQGGIKLTYKGVPKGKACERLVTLNITENIFFDNKTYEGLDYILVDGNKIKVQHFNGKYAQRLCDKKELHTISYVREKTILESKYKGKPVDSNNDKYHKYSTIDTFRYHPDGIAISGNQKFFAVSGSKSTLYDTVNARKIRDLPRQLDNAYDLAINYEGKYIAVSQGTGFSFYGLNNKIMVTRIEYKDKAFETFRVQNIHFLKGGIDFVAIAENGTKVQILNPLKRKVISSIVPKFIQKEKTSGYRSPRITTISLSIDKQYVYIGSNRKQIEIWKILTDNPFEMKYQKTIALSEGREIGAIKQDSFDADLLYIAMRSNKLIVWNTNKQKVISTYMADKYMDPKNIEISSDGQFIMVIGSSLYVWKKNDFIQWDIFSGNGLTSGLFIPEKHQIITIGKSIDIWGVNTSFVKTLGKKRDAQKIHPEKKNKSIEKKKQPIKKIQKTIKSKKRQPRYEKYDSDIKRGVPPIFAAIQNNLYEKLSELLNKGQVNVNMKYKKVAPIIFAVNQHDDKLVQILLKNGANPNVIGRNGLYTPLSAACVTNRISTAKLLLKYGANVNYQYKKSETALTVAIKKCTNFKLVKLLLDNGANSKLIDIYGGDTFRTLKIFCRKDSEYNKMKQFIKENEKIHKFIQFHKK